MIANEKRKIKLNRGCPQGAKTSPFFWTLIMDPLLDGLNKLNNIRAVAYADDLAILVTGSTSVEIEVTFERAAQVVSE